MAEIKHINGLASYIKPLEKNEKIFSQDLSMESLFDLDIEVENLTHDKLPRQALTEKRFACTGTCGTNCGTCNSCTHVCSYSCNGRCTN